MFFLIGPDSHQSGKSIRVAASSSFGVSARTSMTSKPFLHFVSTTGRMVATSIAPCSARNRPEIYIRRFIIRKANSTLIVRVGTDRSCRKMRVHSFFFRNRRVGPCPRCLFGRLRFPLLVGSNDGSPPRCGKAFFRMRSHARPILSRVDFGIVSPFSSTSSIARFARSGRWRMSSAHRFTSCSTSGIVECRLRAPRRTSSSMEYHAKS